MSSTKQKTTQKTFNRRRRHKRARKKIRGTAARPRLSVFRSTDQIYAQLIDDDAGQTLAAASSLEDSITKGDDGKIGVAAQVGALIGQRAGEAGITEVVFDRGGRQYAGRVKALAEAARDAGLKF